MPKYELGSESFILNLGALGSDTQMKWSIGGFPHRRICMLMITHACNLNCSYCYESHKQKAYMEFNLAKDIISREAQFIKGSNDFNELEIDFMGGEPLMNFPLIKAVVEWLEKDVISVPWVCFASTNGTLLSDEIKAWLRMHKDSIMLAASYDGNIDMQFTNRGTENYVIDLDFFRDLWPMEPLHMTISRETLPSLARGVLDIQAKGHEVEMALAQGVDWTITDALKYREQLCLLKDAYLKDDSMTPTNRLIRLVHVFDLPHTEMPQIKYCGAGKGMVAYDVDGRKYGCHMFTPLVLGKENALVSDAVEWESQETVVDDYCKDCVLRRFCPTCVGFNYRYRGKLADRDKRWCPMILAEAMTACEFQMEYISALDKLNEQDAEHGQLALQAYDVLKDMDIEKSKSPYKRI